MHAIGNECHLWRLKQLSKEPRHGARQREAPQQPAPVLRYHLAYDVGRPPCRCELQTIEEERALSGLDGCHSLALADQACPGVLEHWEGITQHP